jgi:hypothetical protein
MENVDEKITLLNDEIRKETMRLKLKKLAVLLTIILAVSGVSLVYWSPWQVKSLVH